MSQVFVTGGAGYIGSVLIRRLLAADYRVRVLDRCFFGTESLAAFNSDPAFTLIQGDTRACTPAMMSGCDTVIDLAGLANDPACDLDPQLTIDINLRGSVHVAQTARRAGVKRFLFSSSCSVYGNGVELGLKETSATHPISSYARAKIHAEGEILQLKNATFHPTILRNATVYGMSPKMRFDLIINVMTVFAFERGKIYILGGGEQWRPVIHVEDVCSAILAIMQADIANVHGEIFNVGSDSQNYQVIQLAQLIRNILPGTELELVPDDPDPRSYNVSFEKISGKLAFTPSYLPETAVRTIHQALESKKVSYSIRTRTMDWYKKLLKEGILT